MLKKLQALIAQTQSGGSTTSPTLPTAQPNLSVDSASQPFEIQVQQERLRQARQSFNLSLVVMMSAAIFSFAGAGLVWESH
jgi:hypothetical protein